MALSATSRQIGFAEAEVEEEAAGVADAVVEAEVALAEALDVDEAGAAGAAAVAALFGTGFTQVVSFVCLLYQ